MTNHGNVVVILILLVLIETLAFYYLRRYSSEKSAKFILYGIICYCVVAALLAYSFKFENMYLIIALWNAIAVLFAYILSRFIFMEKTNNRELIAGIIIVVGIIVLAV